MCNVGANTISSSGYLKILMVDDIAEGRAVEIDMLIQLGFEMLAAENGRAGLTVAHVAMPDLILMDIVMPEIDGLQTNHLLRQAPALVDIPVIAIFASASTADQEAGLPAGANAFLPKPIDFKHMLPQMATLLQLVWMHETPQTGQQEHAWDTAPMTQYLERREVSQDR
jgi:CheY-like chemotaxis protein